MLMFTPIPDLEETIINTEAQLERKLEPQEIENIKMAIQGLKDQKERDENRPIESHMAEDYLRYDGKLYVANDKGHPYAQNFNRFDASK